MEGKGGWGRAVILSVEKGIYSPSADDARFPVWLWKAPCGKIGRRLSGSRRFAFESNSLDARILCNLENR